MTLGGTPATGGYGAFYDFNISGTLAINDGVAVSQILQSTFNLQNGGVISNTGIAPLAPKRKSPSPLGESVISVPSG